MTLGINGNLATLQLDCASDFTIIVTPAWVAIGNPAIEASEIAAISASGDRINIVGEFKAQFTIKNSTNEDIVYVSSNPDLNVLGLDTIELFDAALTKVDAELQRVQGKGISSEVFRLGHTDSRGPEI